MTGPEHYREAERLMQSAKDEGPDMLVQQQQAIIALAQVHATLALVAASIPRSVNRIETDWLKAVLP